MRERGLSKETPNPSINEDVKGGNHRRSRRNRGGEGGDDDEPENCLGERN